MKQMGRGTFRSIYAQSDVITLHANDSTYHMINTEAIQQMKRCCHHQLRT